MYKIFERIPESARRYASTFKYKPNWCGNPRDRSGYCPLGRILKHLGRDVAFAPMDGVVADELKAYLLEHDGTELPFNELLQGAGQFINDWDNWGAVPDLNEAMGL